MTSARFILKPSGPAVFLHNRQIDGPADQPVIGPLPWADARAVILEHYADKSPEARAAALACVARIDAKVPAAAPSEDAPRMWGRRRRKKDEGETPSE